MAITPTGSLRRRRLEGLRHAVLHRLLILYESDDPFRTEIFNRITALYEDAAANGYDLPRPFRHQSRDNLVAGLADRPSVRAEVLRHLVDVDWHANELVWESRFIDSAAATTPEILDAHDRIRAEAEFRLGMALPLAAIITATAYRTSSWLIILLAIPVWMTVLSDEQIVEADRLIVSAVIRGTVQWPALNHLDTARLHFRHTTNVTEPE
jgi:hypothetical protein